MQTPGRVFFLVTFTCFLGLAGCTDREAAPLDDGMPTKFAFTSTRSGNHDVYLTTVDSDSVINLTNHPATDHGISWSPDGEQILFGTDRDGNREVYVMDSDGGNLRNLTNHPGADAAPAWSPDGLRIAFVSNRDSDSREIYQMNVDGSNVVRLTTNERYDEAPAIGFRFAGGRGRGRRRNPASVRSAHRDGRGDAIDENVRSQLRPAVVARRIPDCVLRSGW